MATSIWRLPQVMCLTWDLQRYHETKESLNKVKQISSYWPKTPKNCFLQPLLVVTWHQFIWTSSEKGSESRYHVWCRFLRVAEIWPNFLLGCFAADFDWLYWTQTFLTTVSFLNQRKKKKTFLLKIGGIGRSSINRNETIVCWTNWSHVIKITCVNTPQNNNS